MFSCLFRFFRLMILFTLQRPRFEFHLKIAAALSLIVKVPFKSPVKWMVRQTHISSCLLNISQSMVYPHQSPFVVVDNPILNGKKYGDEITYLGPLCYGDITNMNRG